MSELYVLDSSAVLCVLTEEEGADIVDNLLSHAIISTVNLTEVIAKLQERGGTDDVINDSLNDLNLTSVNFDEEQAHQSGRLRTATRSKGLSLGDRACLALAASRGAIAVTTDKAWKDFESIARVLLVR